MNKIKWYFNRAKIMNIKEINHRLLCRAYDYKIEKGYRLKEESYKVTYIELPQFKSINDQEEEILLNNANEILINKKITIFNKKIILEGSKKFLKDPISNNLWSEKLFTKISFKYRNIPGDPKVIWEINKQQYLLDLAVAYNITNNSSYAEMILDEINEWISENKEYIGINWTSGLEIALRCLSWIYSLSLIKAYLEQNNVSINHILHYIRIQAEFIYNKLSLYSSANNHLIGELTFLIHSSFFIECKESKKWFNKSIKLLNKQTQFQFYEDGVNKEQSINYQVHTMELYFLTQYILKKNNLSLEESSLKILKNACFYLNNLSERDGTVFNIGDEDGGHIIKLQKNAPNVLEILQLGSIVLDDFEIYKNKEKVISNKNLILLGNQYLSFINSKSEYYASSQSYYLYEKGGMYIRDFNLKNKKLKLSFDFGNIGMPPLNAHAHNDILAINININNKPFLVDAGTYKYHLDDGFRDYFRGVEAHNTISINNKNQFNLLGPFMCGKSPVTKIREISNNNITCFTDMYKNENCIVERKLIFEENELIIIDSILNKSKSSKNIKIYFNFDSNVDIVKQDNIYYCKITDDKIKIVVDKHINSNLYKGINLKDGQKMGWQSKGFYLIERTNCLVLDCNVKAKDSIIIKNIIEGV